MEGTWEGWKEGRRDGGKEGRRVEGIEGWRGGRGGRGRKPRWRARVSCVCVFQGDWSFRVDDRSVTPDFNGVPRTVLRRYVMDATTGKVGLPVSLKGI